MSVETIVQTYPKAVGWLVMHGIVCVACGEPYWGTIGELMEKKKISKPEVILDELNEFLSDS